MGDITIRQPHLDGRAPARILTPSVNTQGAVASTPNRQRPPCDGSRNLPRPREKYSETGPTYNRLNREKEGRREGGGIFLVANEEKSEIRHGRQSLSLSRGPSSWTTWTTALFVFDLIQSEAAHRVSFWNSIIDPHRGTLGTDLLFSQRKCAILPVGNQNGGASLIL